MTKDLEVARKEHFSIEAHPLIGRAFVVRPALGLDAVKGKVVSHSAKDALVSKDGHQADAFTFGPGFRGGTHIFPLDVGIETGIAPKGCFLDEHFQCSELIIK